jgi:hypothetical protein
MGRLSRLKSNPKIHRTQLFGGKRTAHEVHAEFGWGIRCEKCGGPPVIMIKSLARIKDLEKEAPEYLAAIEMAAIEDGHGNPDGSVNLPHIPTKYGPMVTISRVASCLIHRKDAEVAAARGPSWIMIEIDRGPGADNPIVQVTT